MFVLSDLNFYKNLIYEPFEVCGNLKLQNYMLLVEELSLTQGSDSNRPFCIHKKYSKFIFHTHPNHSKAYPSVEDIEKILKHKTIVYSIIFTKWGIWILNLNGSYNENKILTNRLNIKNLNAYIYRKTDRGHIIDIMAIKKYIYNLKKYFPELSIDFYEWDLHEIYDDEFITIK